MLDKIGFVAVGQAGGNIGRLFEARGFKVLYLNTSHEDLDTLKGVKYVHHIAGGEGCNKDRNKAKQLVIDDFENISREIYEKLDVSIIFVIFSSGGGTGSGCGPMLIDLLLDDAASGTSSVEAVGAVTVIPARNESIKAQINCYECFEELTSIENIAATIVIDNEKGDKLQLNRSMVNAFYNLVEIPSRDKDERGNVDRAEIKETLSAKGMLVVTKLTAKESSTATVLESFKQSALAPIEPDRVIKYITMTSTGNIELDALEKEVGIPVDVYQTYNDNCTICCLSGLNYPQTRLEDVYKLATAHQEQILKNLNATSENAMHKGVNFLSATKKPVPEQPKAKTSRRDLMRKYMN